MQSTKLNVVIDPGHGGAERVGGSSPNNAVGSNGLLEKDLTLDLARRVAAALDSRFAVTLTRSGDANSSLSERAKVAKDANADVFLSIHFNGWKDPSVDGSEAWVATGSNGGSHALARSVLDRVLAVTHAPDRGVREAELGVLLPARQGAHTAASLLEVAFLTNPSEAERLTNDDYRRQLAQAIADGIATRIGANGRAAVATALAVGERLDGIDIYVQDRIPSWADLRADGVSYAYLKSSEGTTVDDPAYPGRYASARAARFPVGSYHYVTASGNLAGANDVYLEQANDVIRIVQRVLPGDLPPALDFERKGNTTAVAWRGVEWRGPLETYLDRVETALGRTPMIYTAASLWQEYIDNHLAAADRGAFARFGDYPLWVVRVFGGKGNPEARYAGRLTLNPDIPSPWSDWTLWQYNGSEGAGDITTPPVFTRLDAVNRGADVDVFNGGIHAVRGLADLGRPAPHGDSTRFVAYADENGTIMLYSFGGGFWVESKLTDQAPGGPRAAGDVAACQVGDFQFIAFRGRDDDHIYELARDLSRPGSQITVTDVAGPAIAVSDPTYLVDGANRALVYWGVDDHQYLAVNAGGTWQHALDVNNGTGMSTVSGNATLSAVNGDIHVVGRAGSDGHLADGSLVGAWQSGSHWSGAAVDLTTGAAAPAATYQPSTYTDTAGHVHVVFRAVRGEIHEIDDQRNDVPLSQRAGGAPTCAGNPAAFFLDGVAHVVYRRPNGLLQEIFGDGTGGWTHRMLPCAEAVADPGVSVTTDGGRPAAFVVFRGRDDAFHEARLKDGAWSCEPIQTQAVLGAEASALAITALDALAHPGCTPAGLSQSLTKSARAYAEPLYDTGEHVMAGGDLYPDQLWVGQSPGVAFSYGELIGMADLYETVDQMMNADTTELTRIKALVDRNTAYYKGGKANPSLDVSNDDWDKVTGGRYLKLAEDNYEHFAPNSLFADSIAASANRHGNHKSAWEAHHQRAIEEAQKMALAPENQNRSFIPVWPLIVNGFGDHFLTDAFASGHLINKELMVAYFRANFFSGSSLNGDADSFFERVADAAFVGDVADKFSVLETVDYPVCAWGWCLKWHPNINSKSRFKSLLTAAAEAEPEKVANFAVKALHDRLNKDGIEVINGAGDGPWTLQGDGYLNQTTLGIMRKAVQQSVDNINDPSILASNLNFDPYFARVWQYVPRLTTSSAPQLMSMVREYTDPKSTVLSTAAAEVIRNQVDTMIHVLLSEGKLQRA